MSAEVEVVGEPHALDPSHEPPSAPPSSSSAGRGPRTNPVAALTGFARRGFGTARSMTDRMAGGDRRRGRLLFIALALLVVAIVVIAAIMGGGGIGRGGGDGPQVVDRWGTDGLDGKQLAGADVGAANIEGQTATYLGRLEPGQREVMFVISVHCMVTWTDETTPPVQFPAPGYTNTPDSFQLFIIPQGFPQPIESELVYNAEGQTGFIELDHTFESPVPVANPDGADFLPKGFTPTWRVDFRVYTGDCGDWLSSGVILPHPPIGDGGNYYDFEWSVDYLIDSDGRP